MTDTAPTPVEDDEEGLPMELNLVITGSKPEIQTVGFGFGDGLNILMRLTEDGLIKVTTDAPANPTSEDDLTMLGETIEMIGQIILGNVSGIAAQSAAEAETE